MITSWKSKAALVVLAAMLSGCTKFYYEFRTVRTDEHTTLQTLNDMLYSDTYPAADIHLLTFFTLPDQMASAVAPGLSESSFASSILFFNRFATGDLAVLQLYDGVSDGLSTGQTFGVRFGLEMLDLEGGDWDPSRYNRYEALGKTVKDTGIDADGILAWGRWTDPSLYVHSAVSEECCDANKSLHYVFGAATPNANLPTSGSAIFHLVGATSPTLDSGVLAPGTLDASSTVGVLWGGADETVIGFDISGQIGGIPFVVHTDGGSADPSLSSISYDSTTRSFSGLTPDEASVSGFFAGTNATHIGLTYTAPVSGEVDGNPVAGTVQGAAAFKR